jgi:hypothetical protein
MKKAPFSVWGILAAAILLGCGVIACELNSPVQTRVIKITTEPRDKTVTQGAITADDTLSVAATVSPSCPLIYKWYQSNNANMSGKTEVGAANQILPIPQNLTAKTYYFHCVVSAAGAESKTSNTARVKVSSGSSTEEEEDGYYVQGNLPGLWELAAAQKITLQAGKDYELGVRYKGDAGSDFLRLEAATPNNDWWTDGPYKNLPNVSGWNEETVAITPADGISGDCFIFLIAGNDGSWVGNGTAFSVDKIWLYEAGSSVNLLVNGDFADPSALKTLSGSRPANIPDAGYMYVYPGWTVKNDGPELEWHSNAGTGDLNTVTINNIAKTITITYSEASTVTGAHLKNGLSYTGTAGSYTFAITAAKPTVGSAPPSETNNSADLKTATGASAWVAVLKSGMAERVYALSVIKAIRPSAPDRYYDGVWEIPSVWSSWNLVSKQDIIGALKAKYGASWEPIGRPEIHGAYIWGGDNGTTNLRKYEDWLGRRANLFEDFFWDDTYPWVNSNTWLAAKSANWRPEWTMLHSYPPFARNEGTDGWPSATAYGNAASGLYNDQYRDYAKNLLNDGLYNAIVRLGHEMNGNWYYYCVRGWAGGYYKEAFKHFANTVRQVCKEWNAAHPGGPVADIRTCWNPTLGMPDWGACMWDYFPGSYVSVNGKWVADVDADGRPFVDFIGLDIYDSVYAGGNDYRAYDSAYDAWAKNDTNFTDRKTRWYNVWHGTGAVYSYSNMYGMGQADIGQLDTYNQGLDFISKLSTDTGVPIGLCEWGVCDRREGSHSGLDNPYFIVKIYEWMLCNNVAWNVRFNVPAGDLDSDLGNTAVFKHASAQFLKLWNPKCDPDSPEYDSGYDPYSAVAGW